MPKMCTIIEIGIYRMMKDLVFGLCVKVHHDQKWIPMTEVTPTWKKDIVRIYLDNRFARDLWGEELKALQGD